MADELTPFRTTLAPHRETIVMAGHGELDLVGAPALHAQLEELLEAGFARVVLDLRGVSFLDSSGLRAVLDARARAQQASIRFAVIAGPPVVQRVFELTGVAAALEFVDPRTLG